MKSFSSTLSIFLAFVVLIATADSYCGHEYLHENGNPWENIRASVARPLSTANRSRSMGAQSEVWGLMRLGLNTTFVDNAGLDTEGGVPQSCASVGQRVQKGPSDYSSQLVCSARYDSNCYIICNETDVVTSSKVARMKQLVQQYAVNWAKTALSILDPATTLPVDFCGVIDNVGIEYSNIDTIIYLTARPTRSTMLLAYGAACHLNANTQRPDGIIINIPPSVLDKGLSESRFRDIIRHEFTHGLGFTSLLIRYYRHPSNRSQTYYEHDSSAFQQGPVMGSMVVMDTDSIGGYNVYGPNLQPYNANADPVNKLGLVTPGVLAYARDYFNCSSLDRVELETQGGPGTAAGHWEDRILMQEIMSPQSQVYMAYSGLTMSLLEDMGWYQVEAAAKAAEDSMNFGYKAGCSFIFEKCNETALNPLSATATTTTSTTTGSAQNGSTSSSSNTSTTTEPTNGLANCSISDICQLVKVASDQSALFDTCTEPDPTETAAKDSAYVPLTKYIGSAAKQAAVQSSYQGPALSGNTFYYGSVGVQWPEGMAYVTYVEAASPVIAACWVHARNANETEIRFAVEALPVAAGTALDSASVPVVLMDLSLNVSCGAAAVVFIHTIAMERPVVYLPKVFVPEKAVHDAATITGALSVTVGAVAVPIAAMQQGVALALLRMAQCEEDALKGEPLDVSVHPLQFGLGGGAGKYGRGALVGNLLAIPAIWCVLMYLLVPFAIRALTDRTLDASRDFVGWPGMALMPLAVLSEGSAMASVGLLAQGSAGDIIMGLIGLAVLLVTTACWAAELWRMRRQVQLRRASSVASWVKAVHPRFEWERGGKTDGTSSSYLDKRIHLISSSWWLWSALVAQLLSIVVGVAEGLPIGPNLCRARWAVASLAAVLQAALVMTNTVPVELLLLGAIGVITCILVVLIALSTFDVVSLGSTFNALNAVGMANGVLGISLIVVGALAAAYESVHRRSKRENDSSRPSILNLNDLTPSGDNSDDEQPNSVPSLYSGIPSILDDAELREAADGKYVALEPFEL